MLGSFTKALLLFALTATSVGSFPRSPSADQEIKVSISIPQLCDYQGRQMYPRVLLQRGLSDHFEVVFENISRKPLQIWAEGNSEGDQTLSFELKNSNGAVTIVQPVMLNYLKNMLQLVRLMPGETYVREVYYNTNGLRWNGFPHPSSGQRIQTTIRAILTQPVIPHNKNAEYWSGRVVSAPLEVNW